MKCAYWIGLLWMLVAMCASTTAFQNTNCAGCVGGVCFNLDKLLEVVGGEISAKDRANNTYFYQVCGVSSQNCHTPSDQTPAICQRSPHQPSEWHDYNANKFEWSPRPNESPKSGFLLTFMGGRDDRRIDVEFVCDLNATGVGTFEAKDPSEYPLGSYHLKWTTEYACPTDHHGDGDGDGDGDGGSDGGDGDGAEATRLIVIPIVVVGGSFVCLLCSGIVFLAWHQSVRGKQATAGERTVLQPVVPNSQQYVTHTITTERFTYRT
eukprot:TRINITY_DN2428_c0_g1_i5.p1 TRINITY_DN2428_c0_g1~~TRINITY_DN2428_c0_g1_i5.p1  ORF type:complete len:265 (-),score=17.53 TRINITY_DN2428_c0_g1_i5:131-925(-)